MSHDMRSLINLVESCARKEASIDESGSWGRGGYMSIPFVPQKRYVYHGTSETAWEAMQATNTMTSGKRRGISFTTSDKVAKQFAALSSGRDYSERGVVITFDADALVRDHRLADYKDRHIGKAWDIKDEKEMKAPVRIIPDINKYVVTHDFVDPEVAGRSMDEYDF